MSSNSGPRISEIDSLRGLGAIAILAFHLWPGTFFFGWSRVELFFVISGYFVTSISIKHSHQKLFNKNFLMRRLLRILPSYILLIIISTLWSFFNSEINFCKLFLYLIFCQGSEYYVYNISHFTIEIIQHTWCLAIEEQFYLFWPPLVSMDRGRYVAPLSIWVILNCVIVRSAGLHPWTLASRCDGLALGALLASLLRDDAWVCRRISLLKIVFASIFSAATLGIAILYSPLVYAIPFSHAFSKPLNLVESLVVFLVGVMYACLVGLVICHSGLPFLRPLRARPLQYLGITSYGIYIPLYNYIHSKIYVQQ